MKAEAALRRALASLFVEARVTANIGPIRSRDWASATFSGVRHDVPLWLSPASRAEAAIAGLGEREFDLPGHILIDIAVADSALEGDALRLTLEALTVVDD